MCLVTKLCPILAILWTVACQAPLHARFSSKKYWNGLPFPSPGNLPDPGIEHRSPALQADSLPSEPPGKPSRTHADNQMWRLATDQPLPLRFPFFWGYHLLPSLWV